MKTIDIKSLMIGALSVLLIIVLTSSTSNNDRTTEFVASPNGVGIYNQQTKTLYLYPILTGKIRATPFQTFKVAEDGSSMTEIKEK